jgi:hypothetical protein
MENINRGRPEAVQQQLTGAPRGVEYYGRPASPNRLVGAPGQAASKENVVKPGRPVPLATYRALRQAADPAAALKGIRDQKTAIALAGQVLERTQRPRTTPRREQAWNPGLGPLDRIVARIMHTYPPRR